MIHHMNTMLRSRRQKLEEERAATFAPGEEPKPPQDILGAIVASQMDAEDEARLNKGDEKVAGLTNKELIGNVCESRHGLPYPPLADNSRLHSVCPVTSAC